MIDDRDNLPVAVIEAPRPAIFSAESLATSDGLELATKAMENAIEFKNRIITLAVGRARAGEIMNFSGAADKPYFTETLCERILAMLGGATIEKIDGPTIDRDEEGIGCEIGIRVSHPLFGVAESVGYYHSSEIDAKQMQKKERYIIRQRARTRAVGNAIRKMLGLDNFSWDELEKMHYDRKKGGTVAFKTEKPKSNDNGKTTEPPDSTPATKANGQSVKEQLVAFVTRKAFSWSAIGSVMKDLEMDGKALDLPEDKQRILVAELTRREAEFDEERGK